MGIIELVIIAALVLINGVFAGYEIALAAVTGARLQVLVRENRSGAKAALYMNENMEASLAAVQVAITSLGAVAAAIGGAAIAVRRVATAGYTTDLTEVAHGNAQFPTRSML